MERHTACKKPHGNSCEVKVFVYFWYEYRGLASAAGALPPLPLVEASLKQLSLEQPKPSSRLLAAAGGGS